jgi:hypothetical protein
MRDWTNVLMLLTETAFWEPKLVFLDELWGGGGESILGIEYEPSKESRVGPCPQLPYCLRVGNVLTNSGVLPPQNTWRRQFRNLQFLHMQSMSPCMNSTTELISYKESIPWNRCLGSSKVWKFGLWQTSVRFLVWNIKGKACDIVNGGICLLSTCNKLLHSKADYKFVRIFLGIYCSNFCSIWRGGGGGFGGVFCNNPLQCWEKDDSARGWRGGGEAVKYLLWLEEIKVPALLIDS